jgi:hypothetical protein
MVLVPREIVRVDNPAFLVNAAKQACRYERADGGPLAPGYYLAWSRKWRNSRRYDEDVRYFGPLPSSDMAKFLEISAQALGLIDAPLPARHPARRGQRAPVIGRG